MDPCRIRGIRIPSYARVPQTPWGVVVTGARDARRGSGFTRGCDGKHERVKTPVEQRPPATPALSRSMPRLRQRA